MRRLLVRPANWKSPTDCVSRGSSSGGSQAEARVRTPPRFGGLVLAGIQSGYGDEVWAETRARPAPTTRTVAPTPPRPTCLRNSRRFICRRTAIGPGLLAGILALLPYDARAGRTLADTAPSAANMPAVNGEVKRNRPVDIDHRARVR